MIGEGFNNIGAGIGAAINNAALLIGKNFLLFITLIVMAAIMWFIWYRYIFYNVRIRVIKPNGMQEITSARIYTEKKSDQPRIKVKFYNQHDGSPPPIECLYLYRATIKLYKGCTAYQDNNGVLHFVNAKPEIVKGQEYIDIVDPVTVEQYLASRERAIRKYLQKDERIIPMVLTGAIIVMLVMGASVAYGMYQFKKSSESQERGMIAISGAIATLDARMSVEEGTEGSPSEPGGFQEDEVIRNPFST